MLHSPKKAVAQIVDRVATRAAKSFTFNRPRGDSFDILTIAHLRAAMETAECYETDAIHAEPFDSDLALLSHATEICPADGLILEFGVATGRTITHIASKIGRRVYGFDSFDGLPEAWRSSFAKGSFAGALPDVPDNVTLVKGLFDATLPAFLAEHTGPASLLHIDCDLYSSTATVLGLLAHRIASGTVIVFDEYWNYPGWKLHEHKAFVEFVAQTRLPYRYDSFVSGHQQVCVVVE